MRFRAAIPIVVSLVIACSGIGPVSAAEPLDPCAMLSAAEVEKALGGPAAEPRGNATERRGSVHGSCTYLSAGDPLRFVGYTITRWKEAKAAESARAALPRGYEKRGMKLTVVDGLGSAAFWDGSSLFVFEGDAQLSVSLSNAVIADAEARRARARDVAKAILGKL